MEKKTKLKQIAWGVLRSNILRLALKSITGPYGWVAQYLLPLLLDKVIKPLYFKTVRKAVKAGRKIKAKKKVKEQNNANTVDDYLNTLNK